MAVSGHIVYGKVKKGQPVLDASFSSVTVTAGGAVVTANSAYNFCTITALEGPLWIAFGAAGSANGNAATNPRDYVPANQKVSYSYQGAVTIDIDAA